MVNEIIKRLAHKKYKTWDDGEQNNYRWADITLKRILDGKELLHDYQWAFNTEDYQHLKRIVEERHGRLYIAYHDMVHLCAEIDEYLNCGNIRQAQEALDKHAEIARRGLIIELDYGK